MTATSFNCFFLLQRLRVSEKLRLPTVYLDDSLSRPSKMSESEKEQNTVAPNNDAVSKFIPEATKVADEHVKYLLAEDNKVYVRLFCHHLDKLGLQSTYRHAWNGQETVDIYKAHPEQCRMIFMDLAMPVMGGMQASLRIREHEKEHDIEPTIIVGLVVGDMRSETDRLINEFGMDTVLKKPAKLGTLRQFLQDWPV
ncbi:unnamed protein product [Fusarium graminearum]|uniref:Uncharacterized protein n=1 Tax=Gibberella zeae TaxID=5518 RepID=A0A8H3KIY8_GIBZA|nr:unnamed protein product [Fusarium graminearum]CAG2001918.1 unnamed protein product [Fusarium graminearum]CAG2002515.1 unnamed protein product [Fusarium graminearum]